MSIGLWGILPDLTSGAEQFVIHVGSPAKPRMRMEPWLPLLGTWLEALTTSIFPTPPPWLIIC